ncbi:MAG: citramalate synthase [Puniceicoccales bacterium]|jgi:2-isopropylmalate synthase|nr:citramalate synthase [Puniceicoccales bacterium]
MVTDTASSSSTGSTAATAAAGTGNAAPKVFIYDTTLRDGAQGAGISFSDTGKIRFARMLDEFGVDFIEGGFAGSNPRDMEFFKHFAKSNRRRDTLKHAQIVAFGSTRRPELTAKTDPQIAALLATGTHHVTIYGKSSLLHVTKVLRTTPKNNLELVADTVDFLHSRNFREVFFDAEHFFDGYKLDPDYALAVLRAAAGAGAAALVLCDTNGGTLPNEIFDITAAARAALPGVPLGIHTHNDAGLAVANTLEAVRAGATQVQGTINGYGERTGNADLVAIIPALELKMGRATVGAARLRTLRALSRETAELVSQRPDRRQPYAGDDAFSHKAGAHANAVGKNPATFEHVPPESVGNSRHVLVSELSGAANIALKAGELGVDISGAGKAEIRAALATVKEREARGYSYESADGSFKVLLQKTLGAGGEPFALEGFRVIVEKRGPAEPCISEATVKVRVGDASELAAGEGGGPVDALHEALCGALARFYPAARDVTLTDYRVRILNPEAATGALTRVLVESSDGTAHWSTVGVSENIIEASWQALLDSIEYKLRLAPPSRNAGH